MKILFSICATLAGVLHVVFFLMESCFFQNPKIYKIFGLAEEPNRYTSLFAFNQGFYNLFLALGVFCGVFLLSRAKKTVGLTLIIFTCLSMLGAAVVLLASTGKVTGAIVQGLFPTLTLIGYFLTFYKES